VPTPGGLPKAGEVWERTITILRDVGPTVRVVVLERSRGDYWALRVIDSKGRKHLWVDGAYALQQDWLKYIGPAGPETKKRLGL
jgi:hypothetical protein